MSSSRAPLSNDHNWHPSNLNSHTTSRHPSALVRLVEASGRSKGSSATPRPPSVVSPAPNRGFQTQAQLDTITNTLDNVHHNKNYSNINQDLMSPNKPSDSYRNQQAIFHSRGQVSTSQHRTSVPTPGYNSKFPREDASMSHSNRRQSRDFSQSFPPVSLTFRSGLRLLIYRHRI
jgi:hypothetical protein